MTAPAARLLLIPYARPPEGVSTASLEGLHILRQTLARLTADPARDVRHGPDRRHLPHEVVQARALGLPSDDGAIPWAAWRAAELGLEAQPAWGFISPCHWQPGADHIRMHHPATLRLAADEADRLREVMAPWFEPEGIRLWPDPDHPARWLASGEPLRDLLSTSPDRVSASRGHALDAWMPEGPSARLLRRLQSEMQMLLYQHPLHDERRARGLAPVNSFWLHGTGALPTAFVPQQTRITVLSHMHEPWLAQDAAAWLEAWLSIEAQHLAPLAGAPPASDTALVLGGEHRTITLTARPASVWQRLRHGWRREASPQAVKGLLSAL